MKRYIRIEHASPAQDIKNDKQKEPKSKKSFQEEMEKAVAKEKQKK